VAIFPAFGNAKNSASFIPL